MYKMHAITHGLENACQLMPACICVVIDGWAGINNRNINGCLFIRSFVYFASIYFFKLVVA